MTVPLGHTAWKWVVIFTSFHAMSVGCHSSVRQEVVVYVSVDRRDAEPILEKFESSTGIRVRALYDSEAAKTTGLVTRILAEQERPRCDVFWNNEHIQTMLLAQRGLCEKIPADLSAHVDSEFKSPDGLWVALATRARVIIYNTDILKRAEVPKTLLDLTSPRWSGRCAIADPQFGTTRTHMAFLSALNGQKWMESFLGALLENNIQIVNGNAAVKNLVASAVVDKSSVCVGVTDTDDVYAGIVAGDPVQMIIPDEKDGGTLVIPSTVCIFKNSPHPDEAKQLLAYLLSDKTQKQLVARNPGYQLLGQNKPLDDEYPTGADILKNLLPSSRWTRDNFHSK